MANGISCPFDLSETLFLAHKSATYPQPQILWQLSPPLQQLLLCVIYTLRRKLCNQELHNMQGIRDCTGSGPTSAPPCWLDLLYKIHPSLELRSCRYTDTGYNTPTTPNDAWTDFGNSRFLRHGGQLLRPTSWMASPTQEILQAPRPTPDWTDVSPVSLKPTAPRNLWKNQKNSPSLVLSTP